MEPVTAKDILFECDRTNLRVSGEEADLLARYLTVLVKWNRTVNLVGPHQWLDIFRTLVIDSLYLAEFVAAMTLPAGPIGLDLGSGAGLPGIPLRILWRGGDYWLTEKRGKRATFLSTALAELRLPRTRVFHGPAESVMTRLNGAGAGNTADLVVARAFMPWDKLVDFARPLLKPETGRLVILANDPPPEEPDLSVDWTLVEAASYPVDKKTRYFWSLSHEK